VALKITLKPHERLIIGGAVIANGSTGTHVVIENNVPILRQKDIMSLKDTDSPCRRIHFAIQLMYVDGTGLSEHHRIYNVIGTTRDLSARNAEKEPRKGILPWLSVTSL
jgi:flagellar biosynthesis repressor protein FlbT